MLVCIWSWVLVFPKRRASIYEAFGVIWFLRWAIPERQIKMGSQRHGCHYSFFPLLVTLGQGVLVCSQDRVDTTDASVPFPYHVC